MARGVTYSDPVGTQDRRTRAVDQQRQIFPVIEDDFSEKLLVVFSLLLLPLPNKFKSRLSRSQIILILIKFIQNSIDIYVTK